MVAINRGYWFLLLILLSSTCYGVSPVIGSKLYVIHAADTDDPKIGKFIKINKPQFEELVRSQIRPDRLASFNALTSDDCSAESLLAEVRGLQINPVDTVLVFYQGHGAYDGNAPQSDPDKGHFFAMPGGDLPRGKLVDVLRAKSPRLLVLVSDCCNVKGTMHVPQRLVFESKSTTVTGWTHFEELMFCHRGVVDATASSLNEFSWYSDDVGGWFSTKMIERFASRSNDAPVNWTALWPELSQQTENFFQAQKIKYQGSHPELTAQKHMRPLAFRLEATREDPSDTPTETVTFTYTIGISVPE